MSTNRENSPTSSPPPQRRASLNPGSLFSRHNGATMSNSNNNSAGNSSSFPGPISTATNQRRMSITTLGLSGSPTQASPFTNFPGRRESLSSSVSNEDAVDDSESAPANQPTSPFARRVSFGAQALREARGGSGSANGRYSSSGSFSPATRRNTSSSTHTAKDHPSAPPSAAASTSKNIQTNEKSNLSWRPTGEGFNWSAALRNRAERAPSIGGGFSTSPQTQQPAMSNDPQARHQRAASIAIMEQPTRELPREPRQNKPDFFQEKILRADFMD
ncbi:uncharacterized protein TRUGW13939_09657 [Talaromyces rugulosus]|uniref:Uncharacterized protein n=1 Tax=Talaromyces rugulosus TaxID=121627 RepID=A0A7H8R8B8_TALRU|nr:uncharacterized protein TRUGW13939_09657 [Talaromyces rugulosus]QKX62496.1 hypothetical protein TRUGW13939_09657 [Talaromyces rugulosus]